MPVYVYRAADRRGQTVDGVMEAADARAVVERLHREAYFPIKVSAHAGTAAWSRLALPARIRGRDLLAFTQMLATLVEAGLPLDRALAILEELATQPKIRVLVADLLRSVRGGTSLSEALAKHHPRPFSRLYVNMVRAGEKGGVLEVTLRRLAEFLESRAAFMEAIVSALAYPLVITTVGAGAIVFLMTFVIPRFATIFADLGQAIPLPTQILLSVSAGLRDYWWIGALLVVGAVLAWRMWTGSDEGRLQWDHTILRAPIVGRLSLKVETARFTRTLGTMLKSGVPVLGALAVVGDTMTNQAIARAVVRLADSVKRGRTIAVGLKEHTFEADVRSELKRVIGLLEPAIILAMGVLVAFIVVAMLLAIFSINELPM
jgi:type II secretory pathway component PulF